MGVAQSSQGVDTFSPRVTALETYQTAVSQTVSNTNYRLATLEPIMTSNAAYVTSIVSTTSNVNFQYNQLATKFNTTTENLGLLSSFVYTLSDSLNTTVSRVSAIEVFQKTFDASNYANRIDVVSYNQLQLSGAVTTMGVSLVDMSSRLGAMELSIGSYDYGIMYSSAVLYSGLNARFDTLSSAVSLRLSNFGLSMNAISSAYATGVSSVSYRIANAEALALPVETYIAAPATKGTGNAVSGIVLSMGNNNAVITTSLTRSVNISATVLTPGFQARVVNTLSTPIYNAITTYNGTTAPPTGIYAPPFMSSTAWLPGSSYRTIVLLSNLSILVF